MGNQSNPQSTREVETQIERIGKITNTFFKNLSSSGTECNPTSKEAA
jgi:hypothetical protein